jgi:hypothetical protein
MLTMQQQAIAVALVESSIWNWELKVDGCGLYRWYLDGVIETNMRGCTPEQAESALRRFVSDSLRGELKIAFLSDRFGAGTERGDSAAKAARVG